MGRSFRVAAWCVTIFASVPVQARPAPDPFAPATLSRFGLAVAAASGTTQATTESTTQALVPRRPLPPHATDTEVAQSADRSTVAWFAGEQGDVHVVVNDVPRDERFQDPGQVWLSADGKHLAFAAEPTPAAGAERTFKKRLFVDGHAVGDYFAVAQFAFNPADASHAAWVAALTQPLKAGDGGFDVYIDGTKYPCGFRWLEPGYAKDRPDGFVFSPDGKRWAARGQVFGPEDPQHGGIGGYAVMIDGKMGPTFPDVVKGDTLFTPDSRELLYVAGTPRENNYALYRDGVESAKRWAFVAPYSLVLSPDGKHVGFTVYMPGNVDHRFAAEDPRPDGPREPWFPGTPAFAVDEAVVALHAGRVWQNADWSHRLWIGGYGPIREADPMRTGLLVDGTAALTVDDNTSIAAAAFDGTSAHYAAVLKDQSAYAGRIVVDGSAYKLPDQVPLMVSDVKFVDGRPEIWAESAMGPRAWLSFDAANAQRLNTK